MLEADSKYLSELVSTRTEQLSQALSDLHKTQDFVLEAFLQSLWLRDRATAEHCQRVLTFSVTLQVPRSTWPQLMKETSDQQNLHSGR